MKTTQIPLSEDNNLTPEMSKFLLQRLDYVEKNYQSLVDRELIHKIGDRFYQVFDQSSGLNLAFNGNHDFCLKVGQNSAIIGLSGFGVFAVFYSDQNIFWQKLEIHIADSYLDQIFGLALASEQPVTFAPRIDEIHGLETYPENLNPGLVEHLQDVFSAVKLAYIMEEDFMYNSFVQKILSYVNEPDDKLARFNMLANFKIFERAGTILASYKDFEGSSLHMVSSGDKILFQINAEVCYVKSPESFQVFFDSDNKTFKGRVKNPENYAKVFEAIETILTYSQTNKEFSELNSSEENEFATLEMML